LGWRDGLYVTRLHGASFPCVQHLLYPLASQTVSGADAVAVPPKKEIKLNDLALQVGAIVFRKNGHLGWKSDPVGANGLAQDIDFQTFDVTIHHGSAIKTPALQLHYRALRVSKAVRRYFTSIAELLQGFRAVTRENK
jgi:hypothetical protein